MPLSLSTTDALVLRCIVYTFPGRLSLRGLLATADYLDHSILTYAEVCRSLQLCLGAGWVKWANKEWVADGALDKWIGEAAAKKMSDRKRVEWILKRIEKAAAEMTITLAEVTLPEEEYKQALDEYQKTHNR